MKNVCKRLTTILLTFIMILALLPTPGSAQQLTQTEQPAQSSETAVQPTEGSITAEPITGTEVISLREENVKHFDMGNGTFQAIAYSHPVHELDENGQWQDIDFSLSPSQTRGVSTYENKAAGVNFPATYTQGQPILSLSGEGNSIEMTFLAPAAAVKRGASATSAARVSNPTNTFRTIQEASEATFSSTLVYEDVLPDVDFEYIVEPDGVKENIVVNTKKSSYCYAFRLSLDNLIPQIEAGGAVAIYDGISGELRYAIPNPVMYDADFDMSEAVRYQLSGSNGNYLLTVTADAEWINAEGRSFPVKIDPSIIQATENIQDTYIDSDTPNEPRYLSPLLWVRSNRISYIKTPDFGLPNGATLQWANLHAYYYYLDNITQGSVTVGAYQVVNNWSAATQTWSNANNYPNLGLSTTLLSQGTAYVSAGATTASPELLIFDITSAAQSWLQTGNNYGIALKYLSGPNLSVLFKSYEANGGSYKPRFVYQYTVDQAVSRSFAAFDVGDSTENEVALVAHWMTQLGYTSNGTFDNVNGPITAETIKTIGRQSEVVYINGHGERYANIAILYSQNGTYENPDEYFCADNTVNSNYDRLKNGIGAQWLPNSTTKTTSVWNCGTKWVILAPCSQLNYGSTGNGYHWNGLSSAEVWGRTMLGNGQRIHGYVGYQNSAPGEEAHTERLAEFFGLCKNSNYSIVDAWISAHSYIIGSSDWAAIYHSSNAEDSFQVMSESTPNGSQYEIYYIGRDISETETQLHSIDSQAMTDLSEIGSLSSLPQLLTSSTNCALDNKKTRELTNLSESQNGELIVSAEGKVSYVVKNRNYGKVDMAYELSDAEAVKIAENELKKLGLLPEDDYRTAVSRTQRVKMSLDGKKNEIETIEYSISFFRSYNGMDVLSDCEDGIVVRVDKNGLTGLSYLWRDMSLGTSEKIDAKQLLTIDEALSNYQSTCANTAKVIDDAKIDLSSVYCRPAFLQIDDETVPVWSLSTDSGYANCVFLNMYTGEEIKVELHK